MIEISDAVMVFQSAVCVALLVVVLLKFWSAARLDAFRQEMFVVRDDLFDFAASGKISFENPAYRLLRQMMNGSIRYAHQLTFFRVCMTFVEIRLASRETEPKWFTKWENALANIRDREVQERMKDFHERAMTAIAKRLVFGSPLLIALLILSVPLVALQLGWNNLKQILAKAPTLTLSHVVDTRLIENEAAAAAPA